MGGIFQPVRTWEKAGPGGTSLVVQRLRLRAPTAESLGSIPGQRTGSRKLQLKILHASTKTRCSQIIFFFLKDFRGRGYTSFLEKKGQDQAGGPQSLR